MANERELWGEERKVISTRLYRSEFVSFMKVCNKEGKSVNAKLREMIRDEIKNYPDKSIFAKKKEDQEKGEEKLKHKFNLEIKKENVR